MFSNEQLKLMRKIGLNLDFNNLSDDDWVNIEAKVSDYYMQFCLDKNYFPNREGTICESILDNLP